MKNSIGTSIILTLAGESHGSDICAILDGMAPGLRVDEAFIARQLERRRPSGLTDTARREADAYRIVSGVKDGLTTGAPICILIPNTDVRSADYDALQELARPSHADWAASAKYGGFEDRRGGGHFSGRITVGIVAAGAIALSALKAKGIAVGTHILRCGGAQDRSFGDIAADIEALHRAAFPVLDEAAGKAMCEAIAAARAEGDSIGGVLQTAVAGFPAGVGEPWFGSVEGVLSNAVFSLGGVKGVEFGEGFGIAGMKGSEANDGFCAQDGRIQTKTNHSGGINGGISNGMPILFQTAVKPTPSIALPQQSVNLRTGEIQPLEIKGRHDPAIVRRICPVVDALTALVLCDLLALRFGTDYLKP
ncbi:MAG: chorismate synthase [Bacteroidales bacterium]|nr:chorismate synthase [Bacteroidales bacterium]